MKTPKAKESPEARAAREAEEQRIAVMQARADADEAAAGQQLLTRRTRRVIRVFGARLAMSGGGSAGALGGAAVGATGAGSSASVPLGYSGMPSFGLGGLNSRSGVAVN